MFIHWRKNRLNLSMKRFIVNADDYGHDRNRTEAIRECFRNGLLTQTTAMVNMPYCDEAIECARKDGIQERIGLHLNLTFGRPVTANIARSRLFCDENGFFTGRFHRSRVWRMWLPHFERQAVAEEISAQMDRYCSFGLPLMHIDSHHHSHTDPVILGIVIALAKQKGFRSIRLSRNLPIANSFLKRIYKRRVNCMIKKSALASSDYFGAVSDVASALSSLPDDVTVEIMTHPIYVKGDTMPLNCEYHNTDGELSDTFCRIAEVIRIMRSIEEAGQKVSYADMRVS